MKKYMGSYMKGSLTGLIRAALLLLPLVACSQEDVKCGGVEQREYSQSELALLEVARKESLSYCGLPRVGCEFSVYKTRAGTTVRVSRLSPSGGQCIGAIGDEKFYSFNDAGHLVQVIDGL